MFVVYQLNVSLGREFLVVSRTGQPFLAASGAAAKVLGYDLWKVPYLKMAADLGVGSMDLDHASIKRITVPPAR